MYDYDVSIIKEYGYDDSIKKYKVISMNVLRNKGVEPIHKNYVNNRCKVNYEKLSENIILGSFSLLVLLIKISIIART